MRRIACNAQSLVYFASTSAARDTTLLNTLLLAPLRYSNTVRVRSGRSSQGVEEGGQCMSMAREGSTTAVRQDVGWGSRWDFGAEAGGSAGGGAVNTCKIALF